jgi:hypothetical protein
MEMRITLCAADVRAGRYDLRSLALARLRRRNLRSADYEASLPCDGCGAACSGKLRRPVGALMGRASRYRSPSQSIARARAAL